VRITGLEPVRITAAIFETATYTYFAISAGYCTKCGGGTGTRTPDILLAKQALFHLSYTPMCALGETRTPILLIRSQSLYPFSYKRIGTATRTRTANLQGENLAC